MMKEDIKSFYYFLLDNDLLPSYYHKDYDKDVAKFKEDVKKGKFDFSKTT